eukprot:8679827-Lingulodinium_polyedra.AAC.1
MGDSGSTVTRPKYWLDDLADAVTKGLAQSGVLNVPENVQVQVKQVLYSIAIEFCLSGNPV